MKCLPRRVKPSEANEREVAGPQPGYGEQNAYLFQKEVINMRVIFLIVVLAVVLFTLACSESQTVNTANTANAKPVSYQSSNIANSAPLPSPTIDLSTPKPSPIPYDVGISGDTPHRQPARTPKPKKSKP
jgi:hypothetical protein